MKNAKVFKALSLMLVCMLFVVAIAACGGNNNNNASNSPSASASESSASPSESSSAEPSVAKLTGSIEVGTLYENDPIEKAVADEIMKNNPGTDIKFTFVNSKARPAIDQRWRAGNPPAIDFQIFNGMIAKTHEFVDQDKLLDLTPYMDSPAIGQDMLWGDSFLPAIKPLLTYNNKIYSVPTNVSVFLLYYNKKMFEDLGIKPPTTWDEFMTASETLKQNKIDPVAVTGTFNPYMQMWSDYLLQREAGYDETVKAIRAGGFKDNPKFLDAAKKLEDMVKKGYFMKGFKGTDFTAAQMAYVQGKTGMILMGSWLSAEMKDSTPADFQMGVVPFPATNGAGDQHAVFGSAIMFSIAKSEKNPELAIEYAKQLTSKASQTRMVEEQNSIPSIKGVEISDKVIGLKDALSSGDMVMRYLGLENDTDLNNAYGIEVSKLMFGKSTAEQFIDGLDTIAKKFAK
ncbi:ABC transporter substrate-binding protein [Cohnella silvisoli]|uniref:Extracellular solute-binding protein n=1 Tax=Cohnella silvisoli TaxID=2873699 RepID=A0ABV1L3K1_9BACL|nr:extracellular solute-binding protein [Cohnella silvisoli]MCD9026237.1 extracellular solute-binding protein [Cohnella silvisoli]